MEENENSAKIIDLQSLMTSEIGGDKKTPEPFNGKTQEKKPDLLGLNNPDPVKTEEETKAEEKEAARIKAEEEELKKRAEETGKAVEELKAEEEEEARKKVEEEEAKKAEELQKKAEETGKTVEEIKAEEEVARIKAEEENKEPVVIEPGSYTESLKHLFGESITHVLQENEEGEEVKVALEDLEMTQELYEDIVKLKMAEQQEEAKKDTVSTEGISEFTRELIEIDRMGGDVATLLKAKEVYTDKLDKMDLATVDGQKQAVYLRYKAGGKHTDEEIDILIKVYEEKGVLAEKAETSDQEVRDAVKQQVEQAKEVALKSKEEKDNLLKEYKKDLKQNLDQFELDDKLKVKITNRATKRDENGRFEIDKLYFELKNDPEKAARLALFILDPTEYDKQVSKGVKKATQLKSASTLSLVKKKESSVSDLKKGTKKTENAINISLLND